MFISPFLFLINKSSTYCCCFTCGSLIDTSGNCCLCPEHHPQTHTAQGVTHPCLENVFDWLLLASSFVMTSCTRDLQVCLQDDEQTTLNKLVFWLEFRSTMLKNFTFSIVLPPHVARKIEREYDFYIIVFFITISPLSGPSSPSLSLSVFSLCRMC